MRPSGSLIGLRIQLTQNLHFANGDSVEKFNALSVFTPFRPEKLSPGALLRKIWSIDAALGLEHRPTFSKNHLKPALAAGLIEMIDPALPCNPIHKYRRTTGSGFSKGYDRLAD